MYQEQPQQCIEEDEIDLRELFATIWKHKLFLALFAFFITTMAILYTLYKPNVYKSQTILIPKDQGEGSHISGGAAALASMAGINIGGGGGIDVGNLFKTLIENYDFNRKIIRTYHLDKYLDPAFYEKDLVFAANYDGLYKLLKPSPSSKKKTQEEITYDVYKKLKHILSVSTDKKSGAITLSAKFEDRFLAKKLVDIYLREMSDYIKQLDLKEIDEQMRYYEKELEKAKNLDLRANINELLSALVKKKVLSQAGEFYMVKQLTKPQVPYVKDKAGPKRALIVIVAFITSIILGIFMIFFKEFLNNSKERQSELSF